MGYFDDTDHGTGILVTCMAADTAIVNGACT